MKQLALWILSMSFASLGTAAGLADYSRAQLPEGKRAVSGTNAVSVMFLGVTTLLIDDGETAIMTDGYFSRPGNVSTARISPDTAIITKHLQRAGVKSLAVVVPLHSHFDHALDSPLVARQTGALLAGSSSTANIARGYDFPQTSMRVVTDGQTLSYGKFKITFIVSAHLPADFALGEITAPIALPARASDFKVGEVYALLVEHDGRTILIQGSAGFKPGALNGRKAEVVYLGIGGLSGRDEAYQDAYWQETVQSVGAKRVIATHWDNFYKPLDEPLVPFPGFERAMDGLIARAKKDGVEIRLQREWIWVDPFAAIAK